MTTEARLQELADLILEGKKIDWESEEKSAENKEVRVLVRKLRDLERIVIGRGEPSLTRSKQD